MARARVRFRPRIWQVALLGAFALAGVGSGASGAEPGDPVAAVYYRYSVVEYCSLATPAVAAGFDAERARLVEAAALDEEQHRTQRIAGWTAADLEWSNRGVGGFRKWCATEGVAAAEGFLSAE